MIDTIKTVIWGREFTLNVEYDCYEDEEVTDDQTKAVERFQKRKRMIEKAKTKVEAYCRQQVMEDEENEKKDNVFSYIKPDYLFVKREKYPRIALMCKYRYDPEHGLAVVFSSNGDIVVGMQDMIL